MGYAGPVSLWYNFPVEWFYTVLRDCIGIYVETVPVGAGAVFTFDKSFKLAYNMLNRRTVGQIKPGRRYSTTKSSALVYQTEGATFCVLRK